MPKNTTMFFSFFLFLLISMPFYVSALPTGAETCNVEEMEKGPHGTSSLRGSAGYKLNANMTAPGAFEFTLSGPGGGGVEGMLVYVLDASNKRLGQFVTLPSSMRFKDDCGVKSATVTHKDKNVKNFPFKLSWNSQGASGTLTVKALVVRDFKNWARLDDVKVDSVSGTTSSAPAADNDQGQDTTQSNGFFQKYSLFIVMISITTFLYIVGSVTEAMLKRQQVKARSFAKTLSGVSNTR